MAIRKSYAGLFFLLILLLAAQEMVVQTEAKTCEKPSKFFRGICIGSTLNQQCDSLCRKEGVLRGNCKLFKCVCIKIC